MCVGVGFFLCVCWWVCGRVVCSKYSVVIVVGDGYCGSHISFGDSVSGGDGVCGGGTAGLDDENSVGGVGGSRLPFPP